MDREIGNLIVNIENIYGNLLHLTANENILSPLAQRALTSSLSVRYSMTNNNGSSVAVFGRNAAYKSLVELDDIYCRATETVNRMLGAEYSTLRCLTGAHAMMCVLLSITKPGDIVMPVPSNAGGHFCTNGILEITGRRHVDAIYDYDALTFDCEAIAETCKVQNVKVIYLDTSVYLKPHPIHRLRELVGDEVKIVYDASHTLGLIMGGEFQDPLSEGADIISANTHKTFPGPHKAIVAFKNKALGQMVENQILKSFVSSTQTNVLLSLIVAIFEMEEFGKEYSRQVIANANLLARELQTLGVEVRKASDEQFTYTHQIHVYSSLSRNETVGRFLKNGVSLGTSGALGDRLFIRIGVQEITRLGYSSDDIVALAKIIANILNEDKDVSADVALLVNSHKNNIEYGYNYDK